jgi:hypothetical protein
MVRELLGGGDGIAPGELEHDAAGIATGGEEVPFEVERSCPVWGPISSFRSRPDAAAGREEFGQIGEGVGEDFATAPLGTQQKSNSGPMI